jgi:hypothetical protein
MSETTTATRCSKFGDMTIGDCLAVLEQRRAEGRPVGRRCVEVIDPQKLALSAAEISGVEDQAMDRLIDSMHARAIGGPMLESQLDQDPERWDGMS